MHRFSSRRRARAAELRSFAFAGAVALLGAIAVAQSPAARGAAAVTRTITCSLAGACLAEINDGAGPGLIGGSKSGPGLSGYSTSGPGVKASSSSGTALAATSTTGAASIARSAGPTGSEIYNGGSSAGADVYALDSTPGGNGIYAVSQRGIAGYFQNSASDGVANDDVALVARGGTSGRRYPVLDVANEQNTAVASFDDSGNLTLAGELFTAGGCNQGCERTARVLAYAPREAQPMAEDVGEAMLVGGRAEVKLDRAFANAIDARRPYLVTLTPEGDSRGLFVAERDARGFIVREAQGGRSQLPFAYRISAKPFGVTDARLPLSNLRTAPGALVVPGMQPGPRR
jgi:hypothetical protein